MLDFFTVPTLHLKVLFVFVVLAHERRRVLHFNVAKHPTAEWTAQQIIEAFPEDATPRYVIFVLGEGRAESSGDSIIENAKYRADPRSRWSAPSLRTSRSLIGNATT